MSKDDFETPRYRELSPPLLASRPLRPDDSLEDVIREKHNEYYRGARRYRILYYVTRLAGGLAAGVLPFVISSAPDIATGLAMAIVIITVLDTVFSPKERWKTMSRATDLLFLAQVKKLNLRTDEFMTQINIILSTEDRQILTLLGLEDVIGKAKDTKNPAEGS